MAEDISVGCIDLGASSGRVFAGRYNGTTVKLELLGRFPNAVVATRGGLQWNLFSLYNSVVDALVGAIKRNIGAPGSLRSVGVDSWAVDYGLLDHSGRLIGNPISYRDPRGKKTYEALKDKGFLWELYRRSGVFPHSFNTVFQLLSDDISRCDGVSSMLLIPDLFNYLLTGVKGWEYTNATTTSLVDSSGLWDYELMNELSIPTHLVGEMITVPRVIGSITAAADGALEALQGISVSSIPSHDTASAVIGVPASSGEFAYISSGTWSLVGVELADPWISDSGYKHAFTNEGGYGGTKRYLRNVMGFWLLQEVIREYALEGIELDVPTLTEMCRLETPLKFVIDAEDPTLLPMGDMRGRVSAMSKTITGQCPTSPVEFTRTVLDSLALSYRATITDIIETTGRKIEVIHIVGGGAQNDLLCQLTADATGLPVISGPVEAAAFGNAIVQLGVLGEVSTDLDEMRAVLRSSISLISYEPRAAMSDVFADAADKIALNKRKPEGF